MTTFIHGGPKRYAHQMRGLRKVISTKGVTALLFDPGMGKTAIVLDYISLLALKSQIGETRALVVCPLVAVDTWVSQAVTFMSPQVGFWAEALGGSLLQRAEALASRGGSPYSVPLSKGRPTPPRGWISTDNLGDNRHGAACLRCGALRTAVRSSTVDRWWQQHLIERHPEYTPARPSHGSRALHHAQALAWAARQPDTHALTAFSAMQGPDGIAGPRAVIEVINLDTLTSRIAYGSRTMADVILGAVKRYSPDLLVIDESHKIKTASGNASLLASRMTPLVSRRVILTGTVAPAGPLDVFAQWRFLQPTAFGELMPDGVRSEATLDFFKKSYVRYGGWDNREILGYQNLDDMQRVMSVNSAVARKDQALDLPPTTDVEVKVTLGPAEAKAYKEMKDTLAIMFPSGASTTVPNRLVQLLRLRQITSGHLPDDSGQLQVIGDSKVRLIRSLVQDTLAGEKRVVVFCLFSHEIKTLSKLLSQDADTEVMVIEGTTNVDDRRTMREVFGDSQTHSHRIVMIAQVRTMSLAVNELVTASHAVFASLSQNRDDLVQARDRLNRIGQTKPVTFWYAIAPGTVDEVILRAHRTRASLEDALLAHIADTE